jgi:hypothetical protein
MMPEDDWMCLDEVIDGLEGRGAASDWERMMLTWGGSVKRGGAGVKHRAEMEKVGKDV